MRGFSLPEVLIAMLILLIGATGIVKLQSLYLAANQQQVMRQQAQQLAKQKLADLKHYAAQYEWSGEGSAYADIKTNKGGSVLAGVVTIELADTSETMSFDRQWVVSDLFYVDTNNDNHKDDWLTHNEVLAAGLAVHNPPDLKRVEIIVSWQDDTAETASVRLNSSITAATDGLGYQSVRFEGGHSESPRIKRSYLEGTMRVEHETGAKQVISTSVPEIAVNMQQVTFSALGFINQAGGAVVSSIEEFTTVNCQCALAGTGQGFSPSMATWEHQSPGVKRGQAIIKTIGKNERPEQPALCNTCCRDHHDTLDMLNHEQYYRSDNGLPHKHFLQDEQGKWHLASNPGDQYTENCRFKRVDGEFLLYPDWHLYSLVVMPQMPVGNESVIMNYKHYLNELLSRYADGSPLPPKPVGYDIRLAQPGQQLMARGIYIERLTQAHLAAVREAKRNKVADWLTMIPFYDVDLTGLANWETDVPSVLSVSNASTSDSSARYRRGFISRLTSGEGVVSATIADGNTGVAGAQGHFPLAGSKTDAVRVFVH
ncbi:MAG: prepilin-type N-terminal cleavage/methylation domain-containing protein [Alteromonadaceae bacterium]|nr:prepilin-type N-terminal cleavage/methylation domain-containing protein [Alteromonadaceae bacterium]